MSGNLLLCSRDWINNNFISSRGDVKNLVVHLSEVQNMFQQESIFYRLKEFGEFTVSWSKWRNSIFDSTKFSIVSRDEEIDGDRKWKFVPFHGFHFTSFNWISNPTSNPEPQLELSVVPDFRHDYDDIFSCDRMQRLRASIKRVSFDEIIVASRWWEIKRRRERRGKEFEKKNGIVERIFNNISSFRLGL